MKEQPKVAVWTMSSTDRLEVEGEVPTTVPIRVEHVKGNQRLNRISAVAVEKEGTANRNVLLKRHSVSIAKALDTSVQCVSRRGNRLQVCRRTPVTQYFWTLLQTHDSKFGKRPSNSMASR